MKTIIVGMSGGVDSSVSALLLKEQGHRVIGLFMKSWEETDERGQCKSAREFEDVAKVCDQLDIPYYSVNLTEEYRNLVFKQFLIDIQNGLTPNPDVLCNREIKFNIFLQKAKELGADLLATGHYCRTDEEGHLLKGNDPSKDQSYFLYAVNNKALQMTSFPLGNMHKQEVREIARKRKLATSEKKDSTGICFIGKRDFKPFLANYIGIQKGTFETLSGKVVGEHEGSAFYTIGQRKGMALGGEGEPWYVVGKDFTRNVVFVERGANHPALFANVLLIEKLAWVKEIPQTPFRLTAKIRYRQTEQPCCLITMEENGAHVVFDDPQRAATPGQSIVFYQGNFCLGGGVIRTVKK